MSTPFFGNRFALNRHLILISTLFRLPVIFIASASSITVNKLFFSSFVFFTLNYPRQNAEIVPELLSIIAYKEFVLIPFIIFKDQSKLYKLLLANFLEENSMRRSQISIEFILQ
ncbi:hypothetical protein LC613_40385 [Nostoc sphaeroides CHAB 2801]|uniref:Uncharacterized protein n=1 Tax=Nostoc sphaeroides CCNUC1 TaxID=2653204 RepID=A0A5P8WEK2_9NOSO|nr:hypothetical protein [Nostoc sphaeroides]MCC5633690.1 hypothetical protein [Nostoc sphaeroides CHAB 2801]QFS50606.1 hypothetical protein GXM_08100 [Nostoc sphaeroides CCNUC1]